jgi:hypothetical protein
MTEPDRSELGSLFAGRRSKLLIAARAAEADLNLEHPRI